MTRGSFVLTQKSKQTSDSKRASGCKTLARVALRPPRARNSLRDEAASINYSFKSHTSDLHAEKAATAHATSQLSEQPCCGCVLRARALPRSSTAVPEWAAAGATALGAEAETALEETALVETGAAAGTANGDDETARLPKMRRRAGSRGSTTP